MTRAYNTATTQQNSGGAVAGVTAGKNVLINGAFDIWQRGTSFASGFASPYFIADRWQSTRAGNALGATMSRQTSGAPTGFQYYVRLQRDSGNTGTAEIVLGQCVETSMVLPYVNQTVTLSFYARAGANYNASANNLNVTFTTGTGTDQNNFSSSYTGAAVALSGTASLTTSWQRFSYTLTLGSTVTEFMPRIATTHSGTAGANDYVDITGVQIELGSVATPFSRAGGTIQGELAACQRYYERRTAPSAYYGFGIVGVCTSTTYAAMQVTFSSPKRTNASVSFGGNLTIVGGAIIQNVSTIAGVYGVSSGGAGYTAGGVDVTAASGLTTSSPVWLRDGGAGTAYIEFSSEL